MADNATLVRTLYEAWNDRDFDRLAEFVTPDFELVNRGSGEVLRGPDGVRQYNKMWADGFPDGRVTVERILESGACVVAEFTGRGTHTGTLTSAAGSIPATGLSVTLHLCDVFDLKDGKIRRQHVYLDSGALMAQLGVTAGQTQATTP